MNTRLIAMLGVALAMVACGSTTSDTSGPASSEDAAVSGAVAVDSTPELAEASQGPEAGAPAGPTSGEPSATPSTASSEPSMAPNSGSFLPEYEEMVLPNGTELLMSLTTSIGSDTSEVEDAVSADLTQAIAVDGREVLPAGAQVVGRVTGVDGGGRVSGRATIEFRFVSIRVGDEQYELEAAPVSQMAPATRGEDAAKIGIGAGAGALIGGLLGGGAGAGVVLATRGADVRLESGAPVMTELTSPLTVRLPAD
jgi:hypothetical protein